MPQHVGFWQKDSSSADEDLYRSNKDLTSWEQELLQAHEELVVALSSVLLVLLEQTVPMENAPMQVHLPRQM